MNKKIRNATIVKFVSKTGKVIPMRSKLEKMCAEELERRGSKFQYEPFHIEIVPSFRHKDFNGRFTMAIKYTPDFIIQDNIIIELKGWSNDSYPLRRKLLLKYLVDNNYPYDFYEIHTKNQLSNLLNKLQDEQ